MDDDQKIRKIGLKELRGWVETDRIRKDYGDFVASYKDALYSGIEFEVTPSAIGKDIIALPYDAPLIVFPAPPFAIHGMSKEIKPIDASGKGLIEPID